MWGVLIISCSAWEPLNKYSPGGKCERCCYGEILFLGTVRTMILLHIPERNYMHINWNHPAPIHPTQSPLPSTLFSSSVLMACLFRKSASLGSVYVGGTVVTLLPILIFLKWRFNRGPTPGHAWLPFSSFPFLSCLEWTPWKSYWKLRAGKGLWLLCILDCTEKESLSRKSKTTQQEGTQPGWSPEEHHRACARLVLPWGSNWGLRVWSQSGSSGENLQVWRVMRTGEQEEGKKWQ